MIYLLITKYYLHKKLKKNFRFLIIMYGPPLPPPAPPVKDRVEKCVKGRSYLCRGNVRYWDGGRLRDKMAERAWCLAYNKAHPEKRKAYRDANKDKLKAYRDAHKDERKEYNKIYHKAHVEKAKAYKALHKDKIKKQFAAYALLYAPRRNKIRKARRKNDQNWRLIENQRTRINSALKAKNVSKNSRTMEYVGCSSKEFKGHIEKQFTTGMNWKNHGAGEGKWQIDHRRPCASFTFETEEEKHMCFHYTNCQPMWQPENLEKSGKFDPETFTHEWKGRDPGWVKKVHCCN